MVVRSNQLEFDQSVWYIEGRGYGRIASLDWNLPRSSISLERRSGSDVGWRGGSISDVLEIPMVETSAKQQVATLRKSAIGSNQLRLIGTAMDELRNPNSTPQDRKDALKTMSDILALPLTELTRFLKKIQDMRPSDRETIILNRLVETENLYPKDNEE